MRRALTLVSVLLPALAGLALGAILELGDRSSCPLDGGPCDIGPTYGLLHPASTRFNHVFGALVFLAAILLPLAWTVYLAARLRRRQTGT